MPNPEACQQIPRPFEYKGFCASGTFNRLSFAFRAWIDAFPCKAKHSARASGLNDPEASVCRASAIAAVAFILLTAAALAQQASNSERQLQPLNVKPGLWESTTGCQSSGELPLPAVMLERLTPEPQARLEQRRKPVPSQTPTLNRAAPRLGEMLPVQQNA
jgi:hypothetical protein